VVYNIGVITSLRFIPPCNPIRAREPPAGDAWLHEAKLDGYRLQVVKRGRQVSLYSRRGNDWTSRLRSTAEALTAIPSPAVVLDAELCLLRADGSPDFYGLQSAMGSRREHELAIYAFDLLHLNGEDLRPLPLIERRQRLERLLKHAKVPCLYLVEAFDDGQTLLEAAERHKLEGVVSKRRDAPYRSGECRDWRKVKTAAWREANRERWRLFERS
jgi:bifunctional non-homologous end joining protein LigD